MFVLKDLFHNPNQFVTFAEYEQFDHILLTRVKNKFYKKLRFIETATSSYWQLAGWGSQCSRNKLPVDVLNITIKISWTPDTLQ